MLQCNLKVDWKNTEKDRTFSVLFDGFKINYLNIPKLKKYNEQPNIHHSDLKKIKQFAVFKFFLKK